MIDHKKDLKETLLDHYGDCVLGSRCICLKPERPWLGVACGAWKPWGATTYEELREVMLQKR